MVSAMPAFTEYPRNEIRLMISDIYASSPFHKCAQPVASRIKPSGGSTDTTGVNRIHQPANACNNLSVKPALSSSTFNDGNMALASASVIPVSMP